MASAAQGEQVEVPASLDLVERAELGINGLIGTLDPAVEYESYFLSFFRSRPQYMLHWSSMPSGVMPKYLEALALLRCMSGSTHLREVEQGLVEAMLKNAAQDGLVYDRRSPRRPWNVGMGYGTKEWDEDYANLAGNGRLACAMDFHYQLTGDEAYKRHMKRTCERMLELAILKEDYAYYPLTGLGNDFSWPRESGWTKTEEPQGPFEGYEGATTFYQALPIRGWTRWYRYSGDERMLEISGRFARFVMKPKFWGGKEEAQPEHGRRRGHFHGHFHGTLAALRGVLEYGLAAQDWRALEFVRDAYEWARQHFCPQLGCDASTEGCALGDMAALAIQLSDAGAGDFWDDVDHLARNALAEVQFRDEEALRALGEMATEKDSTFGAIEPLPGQESSERVVERNLGAASVGLYAGRVQTPIMMACCNANANQAFYYIWEAAVRHDACVATVNLLFNRFSPWLDLLSYLPFEGKAVLRNKTTRQISVRIPPWVPRGALRATVAGKAATPEWSGRYAQFRDLRGGEELILEFPLKRGTVELALSSVNAHEVVNLKAEFKGSTCLNTTCVDEGFVEPPGVKLFNRPDYAAERAPLRQVPYHIVQNPICWY